jgi:cytochrome c oxidase cbb3-type subunit 1
LFIAYSLVSIWGVIMFNHRRPGHIYITTWYLLGAFFWFPWLFGAANVMVSHSHGVAQAAIASWYAQSLLGLFFTSVALGAIYYLIPKVLGRPIHSYHLASLGFWTQALLGGWTGMTRLTGGPVPAWMPTVSIAATIMMLVPLVTVTVNHVLTMYGRYDMVYHSPTIRFTVFGAFAWSLAIFAAIASALRTADSYTHFTQFSVGQFQLVVYGFFTMTMFGAMYYIVPRLVGCEWLSATFIRLHFWCAGYGMGLVILMLFIGGFAQGDAWLDPTLSPALVVGYFRPYMIARSVGWIMLALAHFIFFLHFVAMMLRLGEPAEVPTLFAPMIEGGKKA